MTCVDNNNAATAAAYMMLADTGGASQQLPESTSLHLLVSVESHETYFLQSEI